MTDSPLPHEPSPEVSDPSRIWKRPALDTQASPSEPIAVSTPPEPASPLPPAAEAPSWLAADRLDEPATSPAGWQPTGYAPSSSSFGTPGQAWSPHDEPTRPLPPLGAPPAAATSTFPPPSGVASTAAAPKAKGSMAKAAAVGGLVGALLSSAVLGTALVATRNDTQTTTVVAATTAKDNGSRTTATAAVLSAPTSAITKILEAVEPGVVSITTQGFDSSNFFGVVPSNGAGTGMVVSSDGYVLTNAHVIENSQTSIKVTFHDRKVRNATIIGTNPDADVALLKVDATGLATVTLGDSKSLKVGEAVIAIGNALALPGGPTVTTGIVSATNRTVEDSTSKIEGLVQTDAAINPGNSGGPLVNSSGEVIGMNTAIIQNSNNIGFAIASDTIKPLFEELKKSQGSSTNPYAPRTFLGVSTIDVTSDLKERYGLGTDKGVLVAEITPGSPADNAGLQPGDVITNFGADTVTAASDLVKMVQGRKPGDTVKVTWVTQDGTKKTVEVALGQARRSQTSSYGSDGSSDGAGNGLGDLVP